MRHAKGIALPTEGRALETEKGPCGTGWLVRGRVVCQSEGV